MMKLTKKLEKEFAAKAAALAKEYNPYIGQAIKYFVGNVPMFLRGGERRTLDEINADYAETAAKDIAAGYTERMTGSYDKWYRYSRADSGRAYDAGAALAVQNPKCKKECFIIEIAECNR